MLSHHREQVHDWLRLLAAGEITPQEAAARAAELMAQEIQFDHPTWQALDRLAGADLLAGPGELLHSPADFAAWSAGFDTPDRELRTVDPSAAPGERTS